MREGEGEMLALGLVHVRAIGVRNLALCRLGETIQDLDVFLTMTPNGNEQAEGSISHSFQRFSSNVQPVDYKHTITYKFC